MIIGQKGKGKGRSVLGRAGIHGFGIHRSRNVIRVHLTEIGDAERRVLGDIEQEATPFAVLAVEEPSPTIRLSVITGQLSVNGAGSGSMPREHDHDWEIENWTFYFPKEWNVLLFPRRY